MLKSNRFFKIALLFTAILPLLSQGQINSNNTSSPYSHYGLGRLSGISFGRGDGMGGLSIGIRNGFQINTANPASYTAIDSMTFLMEFGFNSRHTSYTTEDLKSGSNDANFNHLTFSIPLTKWWAGSFGLIPYASKGFLINSTDSSEYSVTTSTFAGTGTLTKAIIGNGFKIGKNLSLGLNTWLLFGKITDNIYVQYPSDANAYDYMNNKSLSVTGFGITAGLQYQITSKKGNNFVLGAIFEPKNDISSTYTIHEERVLFRNSSQNQPIIDTIQHVESKNNGLWIPMSYGAGFSYSIKNKITFGADYYHQEWSQAQFLGSTPEYFTNSDRYSTGMEFAPNQFSIRSYWDRVKYRFGAFYDKSNLFLNDTEINGFGITFGLGMPLGRSMSTLNISAELGQLGTTENGLIKEKYSKVTLHILLHDRWFIKRKFD